MSFCAHCGKPVSPGVSFCSSCGAALAPSVGSAPAPSAPVSPATPSALPAQRVRPTGVTIIGIVMLVGAAFAAMGIFALLAMAFVMGITGAVMDSAFPWFPFGTIIGGAMMVFFFIAAIFLVALAALGIATGVGILKGKPWAWALTFVIMGFVALGAIGDLASQDLGGVLGLAAAGLVIWYFLQPEAKAWFGKA